MPNNPQKPIELSVLQIKDGNAYLHITCAGLSDPEKCELHMSMKATLFKFTMQELKTSPEDTKHYLCECKDFKIPDGITFTPQVDDEGKIINLVLQLGLAVVPVTITVINPGGPSSPSTNTNVVVFGP